MSYAPYPKDIEKKYGFIRRARFCYLYTQSGKRLVDMYQEAGKAVLGWNFGSAKTYFKNTLNRGASGSFETGEREKLARSVKYFFLQNFKSEYDFAEYFSAGAAQYIVETYPQWRPWSEENSTPPEKLWFLPPFPFADGIVIFAAKKSTLTDAEAAKFSELSRSSGIEPACVLAGITRSIYDLALVYKKRTEKENQIYDAFFSQLWTRKGIWLFPKMSKDEYALFAERALDAQIVVSPDYETPSVIPWGADTGSIKTFVRTLPETLAKLGEKS